MGKYGDLVRQAVSEDQRKIQEATASWIKSVIGKLQENEYVRVWDNYEFTHDAEYHDGIRMRDIYYVLREDDEFEELHHPESSDYLRGWYVRWKGK